MTSRRKFWSVVALTAGIALFGASACSDPLPEASSGATTVPTVVEGCAPSTLLECARRSTLAPYTPTQPTKATGTPITLGMVNQENTPAVSFPELSRADEAAVAWVNEQLGGIDGHPIRLEVCNTKFTAEGSTACGQRFVEAKVPAVLGGIDVFGNSIDVLRDNGIPFVGGVPVSAQSAESENSFQFSGGTWGAAIAFADYATTTLHAKKVAVVYGEFGSITQSAQYAEKVLTARGVAVQMVPYPMLSSDLSAPLNAVAATSPDAVLMFAADTGCKVAFDGVHALGLDAQVFYVGACGTPTILASVPADETNGIILNVEGPISTSAPDVDTALYSAVISRYGKGVDAASAGTVSFRSFMNLYMVLRDLGADHLSPAAITDALRHKVKAPSFMGHPYTCDGRQLAGLPALCSPQQILARVQGRTLEQVGSWVDVGAIYPG